MAIVTITATRGFRTHVVDRFNTAYRTPTGADVGDAIQAADRIEAIPPGQQVTKWDIIGDRERIQLDRTPFLMWEGHEQVPGRCLTCGADIDTEGKFARHYVLDNIDHKNLGHCPNGPDVTGTVRRCDKRARKGTGEGVCDRPLDERGQCDRAADHIEG
jgi:hypothetical protein